MPNVVNVFVLYEGIHKNDCFNLLCTLYKLPCTYMAICFNYNCMKGTMILTHLINYMHECSQAATQLLCICSVTVLRIVICYSLSYVFLSVCDLITFHANCHGNKPRYANMRMWFRQAITGKLVYCNNAVM